MPAAAAIYQYHHHCILTSVASITGLNLTGSGRHSRQISQVVKPTIKVLKLQVFSSRRSSICIYMAFCNDICKSGSEFIDLCPSGDLNTNHFLG